MKEIKISVDVENDLWNVYESLLDVFCSVKCSSSVNSKIVKRFEYELNILRWLCMGYSFD